MQDNMSYALHTYCAGPRQRDHKFGEYAGFLSYNKAGLSAAVRAHLTKDLVNAGWNPHMIQRIPSQSGC